MQKTYWSTNCHKIGYAARRNKKLINGSEDKGAASQPKKSPLSGSKIPLPHSDKYRLRSNQRQEGKESETSLETVNRDQNGHVSSKGNSRMKTVTKQRKGASLSESLSPPVEDVSDDDLDVMPVERAVDGNTPRIFPAESSGKGGLHRTYPSLDDIESQQDCAFGGSSVRPFLRPQLKEGDVNNCEHHSVSDSSILDHLKKENCELRKRLEKKEEELLGERDKCRSLEAQLHETQQKIDELNKEQESLIDIFSEERDRREREEENLRKKIKDASNAIQELLDKIKLLERMKSPITIKKH